MAARLLVTEQKLSVGWSQRSSTDASEPFTSSASLSQAVRAPWKLRTVHAIFLKLTAVMERQTTCSVTVASKLSHLSHKCKLCSVAMLHIYLRCSYSTYCITQIIHASTKLLTIRSYDCHSRLQEGNSLSALFRCDMLPKGEFLHASVQRQS